MNIQFRTNNLSDAKQALKNGCKWIRLNTAGIPDNDLRPLAEEMLKICRKNDATFIIDDSPELAKEIGADGVHFNNGASVAETRRTIGEQYLIGATLSTSEEICRAKKESVDYIDIGPREKFNTEELRNLIIRLYEADVMLPLSVYGNIVPDDIPTLSATGLRAITTSDLSFLKKDIWDIINRFS